MQITNPLFWYRRLCKKSYEAGFKLGQDKANEHGFECGYKHGEAKGYEVGLRGGVEAKQAREEFLASRDEKKKSDYDRGFADGQNTRTHEEVEIKSGGSYTNGYDAGYIIGKNEGIEEGATIQREQVGRAMRESRQFGYHEGFKAAEKKFLEKTRMLTARWNKTNKLLNR